MGKKLMKKLDLMVKKVQVEVIDPLKEI